jgi:hypothetical protein
VLTSWVTREGSTPTDLSLALLPVWEFATPTVGIADDSVWPEVDCSSVGGADELPEDAPDGGLAVDIDPPPGAEAPRPAPPPEPSSAVGGDGGGDDVVDVPCPPSSDVPAGCPPDGEAEEPGVVPEALVSSPPSSLEGDGGTKDCHRCVASLPSDESEPSVESPPRAPANGVVFGGLTVTVE